MPSGRSATTARPVRRTTSARRRPSSNRRPARRPSPTRRPPAGRRQTVASWGWLAVVVAVVLLVALTLSDGPDPEDVPLTTAECTLPATRVALTGEQIGNARTIAQVARDRGLPERAVVIALATAMQESGLRNLDYGDRDSLGLFQQRPSQGWGTPEQVQDPVYAAGKFYDGLVRVPNWQTGELTLVADAVQRSAFPLAYGKWASLAEELTMATASDDLNCY
ncbi:hypothetical protein [Geodermatophilus sp. CPCC 206100]|uniref:hypothetical protein n=1 Tax=Geodermatophilus sp. CPCC 206100 TaxID=3020054 RepID=UPI003AFFFD92